MIIKKKEILIIIGIIFIGLFLGNFSNNLTTFEESNSNLTNLYDDKVPYSSSEFCDIVEVNQIGNISTIADLRSFEICGELLYGISYSKLFIYNISDISNPALIGLYDNESCSYKSLSIEGNYAYIADYEEGGYGAQGVLILNISDPFNPIKVTNFIHEGGEYQDVVVRNNIVYALNGWEGLEILNVSNPMNPYMIGFFEPAESNANLLEIHIEGDFAYIGDQMVVNHIVDISDPSNPYEIGRLGGGSNSYKLFANSNAVFEKDGSYIHLWDVSNPNSPNKRDSVELSNPNCMYSENEFFFVRTLSGLYIYFCPDFQSLIRIGIYEPGLNNDEIFDMFVKNNTIYLSLQNQIVIVSLVVPYSLQEVKTGHFDNLFINQIEIIGDIAYCGVNKGTKGFYIYNISSELGPELYSYYPADQTVFEIRNDIAFIQNGWRLNIVNISDLRNPSLISYLNIYIKNQMALSGDILYTSRDSSSDIRLINISNLENPVEMDVEFNTEAFDLEIYNDVLYLANGTSTQIYNISNPTSNSLENVIHNESVSLFRDNQYLYINSEENCSIYDYVNDPLNPTFLITIDFPILDSNENYLIGFMGNSTKIFENNLTSNPPLLDSFEKNAEIKSICINGDYIYTFFEEFGVSLFTYYEDLDRDCISNYAEIFQYSTNPNCIDSDNDNLDDDEEIFLHKTNPMSNDTDSDLILDEEELINGFDSFITDPLNPDCDSDGLIDGLEVFTYNTNPLTNDSDSDQISDWEEVNIGDDGFLTNPIKNDTDGDDISDYDEILLYLINPLLSDTDDDGLDDGDEILIYFTNASNSDTDGDLISDYYEIEIYNINPRCNDSDCDRLSDYEEIFSGIYGYTSDPNKNDTDNDGISDYNETVIYSTNPSKKDMDEDGLSDGEEILLYLTDATNADTDADGLNDGEEILSYLTNATNPDTDGDLISDYLEIKVYLSNSTYYDSDYDSLTDYEEIYIYFSSFNNNDTDSDGLSDYEEIIVYNTLVDDADSDDDNINDFQEITAFYGYYTNATRSDTDSDGLNDGEELLIFNSNPVNIDTDADGVQDYEEAKIYLTNLSCDDTDGDSICDYHEIFLGSNGIITNPNLNDTDNDGLDDFSEIYIYLTDANEADCDNDGIKDGDEILIYNLDPVNSDSDGDGYLDGAEIQAGTDPLNSSDFPMTDTMIIIIIFVAVLTVFSVLLYLRYKGLLGKRPPINIFISHAVADYDRFKIKNISDRLEQKKQINRAFICEEDLKYNIDEWMNQTVPLSHIFLFIATENSLDSRDCSHEIKLARENDLIIIPMKDKDIDWNELSKINLERELGIEMNFDNNKEFENRYEELIQYIDNFKDDLDRLYILIKKHNHNIKQIMKEMDISEKQILDYSKILVRTGRLKGAWLKDTESFFTQKMLKEKLENNIDKVIKVLDVKDEFVDIVIPMLLPKWKNGKKK